MKINFLDFDDLSLKDECSSLFAEKRTRRGVQYEAQRIPLLTFTYCNLFATPRSSNNETFKVFSTSFSCDESNEHEGQHSQLHFVFLCATAPKKKYAEREQ